MSLTSVLIRNVMNKVFMSSGNEILLRKCNRNILCKIRGKFEAKILVTISSCVFVQECDRGFNFFRKFGYESLSRLTDYLL